MRPLELEDVNDTYLNWMNDVEMAKNIPSMTFPGSRHEVESYVSAVQKDPHTVFLAIIEKRLASISETLN